MLGDAYNTERGNSGKRPESRPPDSGRLHAPRGHARPYIIEPIVPTPLALFGVPFGLTTYQ
jgi:hypothetical protein